MISNKSMTKRPKIIMKVRIIKPIHRENNLSKTARNFSSSERPLSLADIWRNGANKVLISSGMEKVSLVLKSDSLICSI
jgi:hypothetical protein